MRWDMYCKLCGVSMSSTCLDHHRVARGRCVCLALLLSRCVCLAVTRGNCRGGSLKTRLSFSGRWSERGGDLICCGFLQELPSMPSVAAGDWFMLDNEIVAEDDAAHCGNDSRDTEPALLVESLRFLKKRAPFHAACAKWIDAEFKHRSLPLSTLAELVRYSAFWDGDHKACPDAANIRETQDRVPVMKGRHAFALARPDTLSWVGSLSICDVEIDKVPGAGDAFAIGETRSMHRLYRGSYEGADRLIPVPNMRSTTLDTPPTESIGLFFPSALPYCVVERIIHFLPATADGALRLLSSSRSWYLFGRDFAWKQLCRRDDFARVPIESKSKAIEQYVRNKVDWKRLYFCYESRNARRIRKNLVWLVDSTSAILEQRKVLIA
ncbi:hypothetical protein DFJ73DRAFT_804632 [Zopfochytrium polystomum]|nr:hypothetical protein DFJ73DRAFT_804632 [Zopfochytrium polystomum]